MYMYVWIHIFAVLFLSFCDPRRFAHSAPEQYSYLSVTRIIIVI